MLPPSPPLNVRPRKDKPPAMLLALGYAILSNALNSLSFLVLGCLGWIVWMIERALIHSRAH